MLPVIRLEGAPWRQGVTHGRDARARIAHNVDAYFRRFRIETGLAPDEVCARAAPYWEAMRDRHPDYAAAVRGVAEGSGAALMAVVALNVRYEILYHHFAAQARADGCTAFAALPGATADGHLILGQNWDWFPEVQGVVLHAVDDDLEVLCFSEAGIVGGKIGLNSAGLGLAINGLITAGDDWSRVATPFHVRCHAILRRRALDDAAAVVTGEARTCSANFLIGQIDDRVVNLEAAPHAVGTQRPEGGVVAHTNHFLDPAALGVDEPVTDTRPFSEHRLARCRRLLAGAAGATTPASAMALLRDHDGYPQSLCRHPDARRHAARQSVTVASVVMDLHAGAMWISDGPPCANPYQALALERAPAAAARAQETDGAGPTGPPARETA